MVDDDTLALGQCSNLKRITFHGCSLPPNSDLTSILQHLTRLEELKLHQVPFSRSTAVIISQHCRLLKDLQLSSLNDLGDHELRVLVEGCPSLRSLRLVQLRSITEESVTMLKNRHPQISSIGIRSCQRVRLESVLSLLREITIPTIFLNEDENLQISAVDNFSSCLPSFASTEGGDLIQDLLTHEFLLERMVGLLASRNRVRPRVIDLFRQLVRNGNHDLVVNAGVVPALIHHFEPINEDEVFSSLLLLQTLSSKTNHQHCLLTSGVLSIFRPHRLQLLKGYSQAAQLLVFLSPLISQSVVPIEEWIRTVAFLIGRCSEEAFQETELLHSVIHSICMACTSLSHVRSLVDEGILGYWQGQGVLQGTAGEGGGGGESGVAVRVLQAISHLTSIDKELSSRVGMMSVSE